MTTIDSLSPDGLVRILEFAYTAQGDPFRVAPEWSGIGAMATASLVARSWRDPAQALMWSKLRFAVPGDVKRITESPAYGRIRTARVVVFSNALGEEETLGDVLSKLKGLETIDIQKNWWQAERAFDVEWLNLPSLVELQELRLDLPVVEISLASLHPAFHLRTLHLERNASCPAVVKALFTSSCSTLVELSLENTQPSLKSSILASLPLATHLTSLALWTLFPSLGPILATLASFTTLTVTLGPDDLLELKNILTSFNPPLETLIIDVDLDDDDGQALISGLADKIGRKEWSGLKRLDLPMELEKVSETPGGAKLLQRCRDEGVSVW